MIDSLSPRARHMLQQAGHVPTVTDRAKIVAHLERGGLPVHEAIITFQQRFGGLGYSVRNLESHHIRFDLLWQVGNIYEMGGFASAQDKESFSMSNDDRFFFVCAMGHGIPYTFYLDQRGGMYVHDGSTAMPLLIATSPEKYIESDAVLDELLSSRPAWFRAGLGFVALDDTSVNELLARMPLNLIHEASDACTTWWMNDTVRIWRRVHWTMRRPCSVIVANAPTQDGLAYWRRVLQDLLSDTELLTP